MTKNLTFLIIMALSFESQSASLFKDPGQWLRDTGNAFDEDRRQLFNELGNLVTGGALNHEKDKARAERARAIAAEKKLMAEQARKNQEARRSERIANAKNKIQIYQDALEDSRAFRSLLVIQGQSIERMAATLLSAQDGITYLIQLIKQQAVDLQSFSDRNLAPQDKADLGEKINSYIAQINNFPLDASEDEINDLIEISLETYELLILSVDNSISKNLARIDEQRIWLAQQVAVTVVTKTPDKSAASSGKIPTIDSDSGCRIVGGNNNNCFNQIPH